eukprot:SAG22_NODE_4256_length_1325_cov_1.586460_2_plen_75_part_00
MLSTDEETEVRREAALSLARLAADGEGVVPALSAALLEQNGHVKGYAAKALARVGTVPALQAAIDHLLVVRYQW